MRPHRWLSDLATQHQVVVQATERFQRATADTRDTWVVGAERRLLSAQLTLVEAVGGPGFPSRMVFQTVWWALLALPAGYAGAALGLAPGWTLTWAFVLPLVSYPLMLKAHRRWVSTLNAWRIAWATRDDPPLELPPEPEGPREVVEQTLALVLEARSTIARLGIEALDRHRLSALARRPAVFHWLWSHDTTIGRLSFADRNLCQAADAIEVWLSPDEEDA